MKGKVLKYTAEDRFGGWVLGFKMLLIPFLSLIMYTSMIKTKGSQLFKQKKSSLCRLSAAYVTQDSTSKKWEKKWVSK